jgi:hypothetical protein
LVIFALLALATVGAAAAVAKLKPVKPGDYVLDIDDQNGGYQQGGFAVVKDGSKRSIVVDDQYNGIYYPDLGECDDYSVPLTATTIRISRTGRFHVKDETEIPEADPIKVDWKGHWTKASKVEGTIKVSSGKCSDTQPFSGSRTGP